MGISDMRTFIEKRRTQIEKVGHEFQKGFEI